MSDASAKALEIEAFWSWIPAFRSVAEHGSLTGAAEELGVSRSALSRTIKLLEQGVGAELFRRSGRQLELNAHGEQFLQVARLAMRVVHEGYRQVRSPEPSGSLVVSCSGPCLHLLRPALVDAASRWPRLEISVEFAPPAETNAMLLRGEIDLALLTNPVPDDGVELELLGTLEHGVYCGVDHPLARCEEPSPEQILEHKFVAPHRSARTGDPWPPSLDRDVGLRVHQLSLALDLCVTGEFLGVFPVAAVDAAAVSDQLLRLPLDVAKPLRVYAVRRVDVADRMPAACFLDRVRSFVGP